MKVLATNIKYFFCSVLVIIFLLGAIQAQIFTGGAFPIIDDVGDPASW